MSTPLELNERPPVDDGVQCSWAPIYIDPLPGSGQRLTVGVVAANGEASHLARADRPDRLTCLLGEAGKAMVFAAEASLDAFEKLLADQGIEALKDPHWLSASVSLGDIRQARGRSIRDVASLWFSFTSSLHQSNIGDDTTALIVAAET
jgi:hypothetical protein